MGGGKRQHKKKRKGPTPQLFREGRGSAGQQKRLSKSERETENNGKDHPFLPAERIRIEENVSNTGIRGGNKSTQFSKEIIGWWETMDGRGMDAKWKKRNFGKDSIKTIASRLRNEGETN